LQKANTGEPPKTTPLEVAPKPKLVKDVIVKVDEEKIIKVDENKQPCSLVFIGHVDAGKSTISG
jgi:GTPase